MFARNQYTLIKLLEKFYEKCAAYNLRYCTFYAPINKDDYVTRTVKLLIIFICFLIANTIVMTIILMRIAFNVTHITIKPFNWLQRNYMKEISPKAYKTCQDCKHNYLLLY